MTTPPRALDVLRQLLALLVLAAAVAGVPIALWQLGGAYLPDELPSWAEMTTALSGPATGAVFLGLLVVIGWSAWACFALSVAVELISQLRGLPPLRLPGLTAPQQLAGLLVAAVLGVGGGPLLAAPALAGPPIVAEQPDGHDESPPAPASPADTPPTAPSPAGPSYTVQPRDTLGRIAARYLGDWTRFEEIVELNRGRPQPDGAILTDPGLIRPGWVLVLPPDASLPVVDRTADEVTVRPGDTLADIAAQHGLDGWQPIFALNEGEPLPGGGRFTDPDLILPGQVLDLPPADRSAPASTPATEPEPEPSEPAPPQGSGPPAPTESPPATSSPATTELPFAEGNTKPEGAAEGADADAEQQPSELAIVLGGSGALLAAGLGAAWLTHRRQRLRRRRPGRRLAPLPAELSATQATVASAAAAGRANYGALDRALRELSVLISQDTDGVLPDVVAARLDGERIELRLHTATGRPPPAPWTVDETGEWWSLSLSDDTGVDADVARARLAPYPTLVTIGTDRAHHWLLDLERVGLLRLAGATVRCENFVRHLAAELAVNGWSDLITVTTVGFGDELIDLAPDRVHPVADPRAPDLQPILQQAAAQHRRGEVLAGRLRAAAGDGWMPHVVLAPHEPHDDDLPRLASALNAGEKRAAIAVVLGGEASSAMGGWVLTLTDTGWLSIPALALRLPAPQLTVQQARDIAALLAFERDEADEPIPAIEGNRPWQLHTDAGGALRGQDLPSQADESGERTPELRSDRQPRRSALVTAAERAVGTSGEDGAGAEPAPTSPPWPDLRREMEDDLDQLDNDLADWWSPDCTRPRLTVLGQVTLRAHGDEASVTRSGLRRRYEETVAYLATRPHGATADEAATALQPARRGKNDPVSARAYVHRVTAGARAWLGTDPATGHKHLSSGHYTLTGVLVDADLFRQLRARAALRGDDGLPDLLAALQLVSGPPFAQRPAGYEWLEGLDFTLTAAICDVAHQVVTAALADGDLEAARIATATALLVAPDDEQVLLDAMWVAFHAGNRAEAETYVARIVAVHDGEDEMDLPMSTAEIIKRARQQFLDRAS